MATTDPRETQTGVEWIRDGERPLALIVRAHFDRPGITFFTPDDFSQQLAHMHHPAGKVIDAHVHNRVERQVAFTQEVLMVQRGRLRVDFYRAPGDYLESRVVAGGDVLMLVSGGHGFETLEEVVMFEIKQGPHAGSSDKTRFDAVPASVRRIIVDR
jgi:hypothetical protein